MNICILEMEMPWNERSAMDEKVSFIMELEAGQAPVTELC